MISEKGKGKLTKPSNELAKIIERVNLLPANIEIPILTPEDKPIAFLESLVAIENQARKLIDRYGNRKRLAPEIDIDNIEERLIKFKKHILRELDFNLCSTPQAIEKTLKNAHTKEMLFAAIFRYEKYESTRRNLNSFIGIKNSIIEKKETISVYRAVYFNIDDRGILSFEIDELLEALNGIEFSRLSKCEICKRIFWLQRKGVVCCSLRCGNVFNNRKARETYNHNPVKYKIRKIKEESKRKRTKLSVES